MSRPCVLILIDSATRDAMSQLLVAHYLARKGVRVHVGNQLTWLSLYERYRPQVFYTSWFNSESLLAYLCHIQRRTRLLLVDQEGGRMGEEAFKRTMRDHNGAKLRAAKTATRVIAWGRTQAQWLQELDCIEPERIVVTGCPRLDPYLLEPRRSPTGRKFVGVTLRTDRLTSKPRHILEAIYESLFVDPKQGLTPGLPVWAQYEDWLWQAAAVVRHMLKIVLEVTRKTSAPVVLRPGPWEQAGAYQFLYRHFPQISIEPMMLQHEYVRNACVTLDASSALGLESILAGTPVISVNALVARLDDHVGGPGGTRLNAPYRRFYWHPATVEEAVDQILQAERGELPLSPAPEGLAAYFRDYVDWPTLRPASFRIGDLILEMLDLPARERWSGAAGAPDGRLRRRAVYRLPGLAEAHQLRSSWQYLVQSPDRQLFRRYHYFSWTYPHRQAIAELFEALWQRYEVGEAPPPPVAMESQEPMSMAEVSP